MSADLRRRQAALLVRNGFGLVRTGKHAIWRHPSGAMVVCALSTSDHRGLQNLRRDIRRSLGQRGLSFEG